MDLGISALEIKGDSNLIINQVFFDARDCGPRKFCTILR